MRTRSMSNTSNNNSNNNNNSTNMSNNNNNTSVDNNEASSIYPNITKGQKRYEKLDQEKLTIMQKPEEEQFNLLNNLYDRITTYAQQALKSHNKHSDMQYKKEMYEVYLSFIYQAHSINKIMAKLAEKFNMSIVDKYRLGLRDIHCTLQKITRYPDSYNQLQVNTETMVDVQATILEFLNQALNSLSFRTDLAAINLLAEIKAAPKQYYLDADNVAQAAKSYFYQKNSSSYPNQINNNNSSSTSSTIKSLTAHNRVHAYPQSDEKTNSTNNQIQSNKRKLAASSQTSNNNTNNQDCNDDNNKRIKDDIEARNIQNFTAPFAQRMMTKVAHCMSENFTDGQARSQTTELYNLSNTPQSQSLSQNSSQNTKKLENSEDAATPHLSRQFS